MRRKGELAGLPQGSSSAISRGSTQRAAKSTARRARHARAIRITRTTTSTRSYGDVGLYAAANAKLTRGPRCAAACAPTCSQYNVIDNCAAHDIAHPVRSNPPGDASCLSQADFGKFGDAGRAGDGLGRDRAARASLVLGPFAGLRRRMSYGQGVRSIDPSSSRRNRKTPFAQIESYEAGRRIQGSPGDLDSSSGSSGSDPPSIRI